MSYRLLRAMKVQCADGTVEQRQPGDPCPEADNWPNAQLWVKRGHIERADGKVTHAYDRSKIKPMVSVDPGKDQKVPTPPADDGMEQDRKDLQLLNRSDLEELAKEHSVSNPKGFANKDALINAILFAKEPTDAE